MPSEPLSRRRAEFLPSPLPTKDAAILRFSGLPDGLWDLYSGLCDSAEGRVTLLFDPFAPIS